jgi:hypothetical protein
VNPRTKNPDQIGRFFVIEDHSEGSQNLLACPLGAFSKIIDLERWVHEIEDGQL